MKKILILFYFLSILTTTAFSQWLDGGRSQSKELSGNGAIYVYKGVLYLWNEQNHFQISSDNGLTWSDPKDSIGGANPHVKKITAASDRIYAGLNFGTGNGAPIFSVDKGVTWKVDTLGAPGHALGWNGMPVVSDIYAWGHWLYVKWDQPVPYSIKSFDTPFVFDTIMNKGANQPYSVIAKGDTLFAAGSKIYYSVNGGLTWYFPQNNGFTGYGGKLFVEGSRLYMFAYKAFAQPSTLFYSDDNAENWTEVDVSSLTKKKDLAGSYFFPQAYFIKGTNIWFAAGSEKFNTKPNIYKSSDFGSTWATDTLGLKASYVNGVNDFAFTNDGYLWVSPSYNNIFKQKISSPSGIELTSNNNSIEVSPNPASVSIKITILNDDFSGKSIFITNSLGIKVRRLDVDEMTGQRTINIPIEDLPSGVYHCTINSVDKVITKSFVVIK